MFGSSEFNKKVTIEAPMGYPAVFVKSDSPIKDELFNNFEEEGLFI